MPYLKFIRFAGVFAAVLLMTQGLVAQAQPAASLKGAWELTSEGTTLKKVVIATDNYLMQTTYDTAQNQFVASTGGHFTLSQDSITLTLDFHSSNGQLAGNKYTLPLKVLEDSLRLTNEYGSEEIWHRIDRGNGELAGCWQITQRQQQNEMHTLPDGDRKTLKILSGNRFEWAAFNTATGAFSGCGGGTYTFENGKYTEHIDFFSRDSSRVGMSLTFNDSVQDSLWHHRGKSTKGAPVYEIWKLK